MLTRRTFLTTGAALPVAGGAVAAAPDRAIDIREIYDADRGYSDLALDLEGLRLEVQGFMAPPLKADARFFVLTKMPMAVCPFCESEAEWPEDILAVYTKRIVRLIPYTVGIKVSGILELGGYRDEDTGFLSMVRLVDATYG